MFNEKMRKEADKYGIEYYKKGRILVWHDEFDTDKLDENKWCFERSMGGGDRIYDNSEKNCRVEDGNLHLQVHATDDPEFPYTLPEGVTTKYTMNWKYGYLEMRAKVPYRHGAWPSFWALSRTVFKKAPWMSEIDIFEVFSDDRHPVANLHKWMGAHATLSGGEGSLSRAYEFKDYENLNNEYHVYGFEWNPEFTIFYVDGEEFKRFPIDPVNGNFQYNVVDGVMGFHDFHYVLINNEIFTPKGSWRPEPFLLNENDPLPIDYYVDYIRLYQNPETEELKLKPEIDAVLAEQKAKEEAKKAAEEAKKAAEEAEKNK